MANQQTFLEVNYIFSKTFARQDHFLQIFAKLMKRLGYSSPASWVSIAVSVLKHFILDRSQI